MRSVKHTVRCVDAVLRTGFSGYVLEQTQDVAHLQCTTSHLFFAALILQEQCGGPEIF